MPPIYTYTAGEPGLFVNSYLVEAPDGVVAVDAGLLVSDARAFRARLDALSKPLLGVLVTHAHPDHFNGVVELTRGLSAPVYATPEVTRVIEEIADAKRAQWGPTYGDEWPAETRYPDAVVGDGETLELGGLRVRAHELGPCESHAEALFVLDADGAAPVAFVGDLAYHGMHPYNADGHTGRWLRVLDEVPALLEGVGRLYPGHGAPGGLELLDRQREYLHMYREVVRRLAAGAPQLSGGARDEVVTAMSAYLPGAPLAWLAALSADPVAAELAADAAAV